MKRLFALEIRSGFTGLLLVFTLVMAACTPTAGAQDTANTPIPGGNETVQIADTPDFGRILVTTNGMTLYTNTAATADDPLCVEQACVDAWPPYLVEGEISASEEIRALLGTTTRPDGSTQLTFNQQPLYTFFQDAQPGDVKGNGFTDLGGTWQVISLGGSAGISSPTPGSGYGGGLY